MGTLSKEERIRLSDSAKQFVESPVMNGVFTSLLKSYMSELIATPAGDDRVKHIHAKIVGLEDIKKDLQALVNDGTMIRNR